MDDISVNLAIKVWAAFSPSGLFKLVRNTKGDCWQALCETQNSDIAILKKRGYRVRPAVLDLETVDLETD